MRKKRYLKILVIVVVSFFVSSFANREIFIANSPKLDPNATKNLSYRVKNLFDSSYYISLLFSKPDKSAPIAKEQLDSLRKEINLVITEQILNNSLKSISKGTYAKETPEGDYYIFNDEETEWIEYTYNVRGKKITVKVPKGENPPSQDQLEQ